MKLCLCIFISMVVATKAHYHDRIGIPLAAKIKAYEDKLFADPEMQSRVAGGEPSFQNAHPFIASLRIQVQSNSSLCSAALVTTTRLVTAGHCLDGATIIGARLGSNYLFHGGSRYRAKNFFAHPQYSFNPTTQVLMNDIGILNLKREVKLSDAIKIISLPRSPADFEKVGEPATVAGWGFTSDAQINSTTPFDQNWEMTEIVPPIASEESCLREYESPNLNGTVVCTEGENGRGICHGDSGSPLVILRDIPILIGVASFGHSVCEAGWYSVFTKTEPYKDFIMK